MSFLDSFVILLGLLVHCLLGLFLCDTALLGLLVGSPLGGYRCLVMWLAWLLLILRFLVLLGMRFLVGQLIPWVGGSGPGRKRIRFI